MKDLELRKQIIDACLYLQKTGLIARTWGNVSAKLNDNQFIITPSGLAYELTKPEDLVIVNIKDCSYDKNQRKPSSEKLVHASVYRNRKDVNFIVHTHQHFASAICAEEKDITLSDGSIIPCAKYALSSTDMLRKSCEEAVIKHQDANAILMARHGVIAYGKTDKEVLDKVTILEKECEELFNKRVNNFYIPENMKAYLDDYAQMFPLLDNEDKEAIEMVSKKNAAAMLYAINSKPLGFFDRTIQHLVYKYKYSKLRGYQNK